MSIMMCECCDKFVDTDYTEMVEGTAGIICFECSEDPDTCIRYGVDDSDWRDTTCNSKLNVQTPSVEKPTTVGWTDILSLSRITPHNRP
jgi:hypothetical protein